MSPEAHRQAGPKLAALTALGALLLLPGPAAQAQTADCETERQVPGRALDEATYRQLNAVYEVVGEEKYDEAFEDLKRMLGRAGRDEYLAAILNQAIAQVEWARENYDSALRHFETAVELDVLPNQAHFALMYQIAQLYYMQERYAEALERLELWFCTTPKEQVASAAYVLEASIHGSMEHYAGALEAIEIAIEMEEEPKEQWYQLKLAAHYELKQFPEVAETLETLVEHWPGRKSHWVQLAQSYLKLDRPDRALAAMALAHRKGLLDAGRDIEFLSGLYSMNRVPYKAAEVLQKGIEGGIVESTRGNWTRVAGEWYDAEELEKSLAAYAQAGRESTDGEIHLRRAYILVDLERWGEAKEALDAAIGKGGLEARKLGEAYLLRGMAQFNLEDFDAAGADWDRASQYPPTRAAAEQWLAHLREERRRRAL